MQILLLAAVLTKQHIALYKNPVSFTDHAVVASCRFIRTKHASLSSAQRNTQPFTRYHFAQVFLIAVTWNTLAEKKLSCKAL